MTATNPFALPTILYTIPSGASTLEASAARSISRLQPAHLCRELLALAWSDLNLEFESPIVTISYSVEQTKQGSRIKRPKNNKTRRVPLSLIAAEALRRQQSTVMHLRAMKSPLPKSGIERCEKQCMMQRLVSNRLPLDAVVTAIYRTECPRTSISD